MAGWPVIIIDELVAQEAQWQPKKADIAKRVVIVGAGVADLEAACVASAHGHQVTVISNSHEVAGKTRLHAELPGGENLSSTYDYQLLTAQINQVDFQLGKKADLNRI